MCVKQHCNALHITYACAHMCVHRADASMNAEHELHVELLGSNSTLEHVLPKGTPRLKKGESLTFAVSCAGRRSEFLLVQVRM